MRNKLVKISLVFVFLCHVVKGQDATYPEIDSVLQMVNYNFQKNGQLKSAILFNLDIVEQSRKKNYAKGIGWGYYNIGNLLSTLSRYEESLKYFALAEKELQNTRDFHLTTKLLTDIGKVNHFLGLYDIALNYYNRAIVIAEKIHDNIKKEKVLDYIYGCKASNFERLNQLDSVYIYFKKAYKINQSPIIAANIANYFIHYQKNHLDSAEYYLKAGSEELRRHNYDLVQSAIVLEKYGDYYGAKGDPRQALTYYTQSLELARQIQKLNVIQRLYQSIAAIYVALKDEKGAATYQLKYSKLTDSLATLDKRALSISISKLLQEKEIEQEGEKAALDSRNALLLAAILASAMLLIFAAIIFYRRRQRKGEIIIKSQQEEIYRKEMEKKSLEHKVNYAFHEVLNLAKTNDPAFLARFKEVYPEFCQNLNHLSPNLLTSELTFCAYLKLNFSAKEIANYTFVTLKAVQGRKTRIRKKLNIASEDDLYIWINQI